MRRSETFVRLRRVSERVFGRDGYLQLRGLDRREPWTDS